MSWELRLDQGSVPMDAALSAALASAVQQPGFTPPRMASGAGHDAMIVAARMPVAMLFVRCEKGISHHPAEAVSEQDVAAALGAGLRMLDSLESSRA